MVTVRLATAADVPAMGRLHVRAWQAAYQGHVPDDYLDGLRAEDRVAGWASDGTERTVDALGVAVVPEVRYRRRSRSEDSSSTTPLGTE
jgi:hypothetical protein